MFAIIHHMAEENRSQRISAPHSRLWLREATGADAPLRSWRLSRQHQEYRDRLTPPSGAFAETEAQLRATLVHKSAVLAGLGNRTSWLRVY